MHAKAKIGLISIMPCQFSCEEYFAEVLQVFVEVSKTAKVFNSSFLQTVASFAVHLIYMCAVGGQHQNGDVCLEVRGEIIRTVLFFLLYTEVVHRHEHT